MHGKGAALPGEADRGIPGGVKVVAADDQLSAGGADGGVFVRVVAFRHEDSAIGPVQRGRPGQGVAEIAAGCGDQSPTPRLR